MRERSELEVLRQIVQASSDRDAKARRAWRGTSLIDGALQAFLDQQQEREELCLELEACVGQTIYSEDDAARFLQMSTAQLRELRNRATGPRAVRLWRWVKYRLDSLEEWLRSQPSARGREIARRRKADQEYRQLMIELAGRHVFSEGGAASLLGVPVEYLRLLRSHGREPRFGRLHACVMYRRDALDAWVRACEADPSMGDPFAREKPTSLRRWR